MLLGNHDVDAVLGTDMLQFYDVYTDFPHSRMFLKQNDYFRKMFRKVP